MRRFEAAEYQLFTEKENKVERAAKKAASELAIYAVANSPAGKLVAAGGLDKTIRIWDAESGELRHTLANHPGFVYALAFAGDERLVSAGHTGKIQIWQLSSPEPQASFKLPAFAHAAALSPNHARLAIACADGKAYVLPLT